MDEHFPDIIETELTPEMADDASAHKNARNRRQIATQTIALCVFAVLLIAALVGARILRGAPLVPQRVEHTSAGRDGGDNITKGGSPTIASAEPGAAEFAANDPTFTRTAVVIDGVEVGTLASLEAANTLINDVIEHYEAMIERPGQMDSELLNDLQLVPDHSAKELTSVDALFTLLTGADTPIALSTIVVEYAYQTEEYSISVEEDPYLPLGNRVVVDYGLAGEMRTTFTYTFLNGQGADPPVVDTVDIVTARDRLIRVGTREIDPAAKPDLKLGRMGKSADGLTFINPVNGQLMTYFWQMQDDSVHLGIDYEGERGNEVNASCGGMVVSAIIRGGYGLMVEIDHGGGFVTRYAHLGSVCVDIGDVVEQGQKIGEMGSSGRCEGVRLHFELRIDGEAFNPLYYIKD